MTNRRSLFLLVVFATFVPASHGVDLQIGSRVKTFLFDFCLYVFDVYSDIINSVEYIKAGDVYWGALGIVFVCIPAAAFFAEKNINSNKKDRLGEGWTKISLCCYLLFAPLFVPFAAVGMIIYMTVMLAYKILALDINIPKTRSMKTFEAYGEGCPQTVLTTYVLLKRGPSSAKIFNWFPVYLVQYSSLFFSIVGFTKNASENIIFGDQEPQLAKTLKAMPYFLLHGGFRLVSYAFLFAYYGEYALFIPAVIFMCNLCPLTEGGCKTAVYSVFAPADSEIDTVTLGRRLNALFVPILILVPISIGIYGFTPSVINSNHETDIYAKPDDWNELNAFLCQWRPENSSQPRDITCSRSCAKLSSQYELMNSRNTSNMEDNNITLAISTLEAYLRPEDFQNLTAKLQIEEPPIDDLRSNCEELCPCQHMYHTTLERQSFLYILAFWGIACVLDALLSLGCCCFCGLMYWTQPDDDDDEDTDNYRDVEFSRIGDQSNHEQNKSMDEERKTGQEISIS